MFAKWWTIAHQWFVPSHHNDFHPHLIAERGAFILFALILGAEAFLVSHVITASSGIPSLAAAGAVETTALPPFASWLTQVWLQQVVAPLAYASAQPNAGIISFVALAVIAAALMAIIAATISSRRRRFKPVGYVAGGTMLAFAATLLFFNTHVFLPSAASQYAASVAQSGAALQPPPNTVPQEPAQQALAGVSISTSTLQVGI